VTFKPSTHRKCFIDRKIREKSYPTAASLARDYEAEYGAKIGVRTIANDIAEMRCDFNAPIHYDSENRGYVYTDPSFQVDIFQDLSKDIPLGAVGMGGIAALGLTEDLLPLVPASVFLSDWHRKLLSTLVDRLNPDIGKKCRALGKISVIRRGDSSYFFRSGHEEVLMDALEHNRELLIEYGKNGCCREYHFRPIHLIHLENDRAETTRLILGTVSATMSAPVSATMSPTISAEGLPYALLNGEYLQKAIPSGLCFTPVKSIHIQAAPDGSLEFLLSYEHNDTILVFIPKEENCGEEYSLLSRLDIYPQRRP
jgi:hypothetical protein